MKDYKDELIKKHVTALNILEAIKTFERRKELAIGSIEGFPGIFPRVRRELLHKIDIYNRSIKRLYSRYEKNLA